MIEPSFFFGAMYVAYALSVGVSMLVFLIGSGLLGFEILKSIVAVGVILVVLTPLLLRISRMIWINFFVSYDQNASANTPPKTP
jgi:hypothetical protein